MDWLTDKYSDHQNLIAIVSIWMFTLFLFLFSATNEIVEYRNNFLFFRKKNCMNCIPSYISLLF